MKALQSIYVWADHKFPLYKANYNLLIQLVTLLADVNYPASAFEKLEPIVCNNPNVELEKRKAAWVQFYINAFNSGFKVDLIPLPTNCDSINPAVELSAIE